MLTGGVREQEFYQLHYLISKSYFPLSIIFLISPLFPNRDLGD